MTLSVNTTSFSDNKQIRNAIRCSLFIPLTSKGDKYCIYAYFLSQSDPFPKKYSIILFAIKNIVHTFAALLIA